MTLSACHCSWHDESWEQVKTSRPSKTKKNNKTTKLPAYGFPNICWKAFDLLNFEFCIPSDETAFVFAPFGSLGPTHRPTDPPIHRPTRPPVAPVIQSVNKNLETFVTWNIVGPLLVLTLVLVPTDTRLRQTNANILREYINEIRRKVDDDGKGDRSASFWR